MTDFRVAVFGAPLAAPIMRMVERPHPAAHAALVATIACALDAEDVRLRAGLGTDPCVWPATMGRHIVGAIDALGSGLTEDAQGNRLRPGTPVLIQSTVPCGRCDACLRPVANGAGCLAPHWLGGGTGFATPPHLWGGLADAVSVPGAALHALPLTMPPWLATLAEPFAVCLRVFRQVQSIGRFAPGASVAIVGRDLLALLCVVVAQELGAGRIVLIGSPDAPFLRLARLCGAETTIDTAEVSDPVERVAIARESVGERGADLTIALGSSDAEAIAILREGGAHIAVGCAFEGPAATTPWHLVRSRHLAILGCAGFAGSDIPVALRMLYRARDRYPFADWHARFPLSEAGIETAFAALSGATTPRALVTIRPGLVG